MKFTEQQLAAVDISRCEFDACVVAGPGSGKTTVLVEYFKRLVEAGADPLRILAITFTEKAASNMRKKLAEAFEHNLETRARLERAWVSTVHGFCSRLLRENAVAAGLDPEFTVAAELESWRLQHESIDAAVEEMFQHDPAAVRALVRGLSSWEFELAVLSAYDAMRCAGMTVADLDRFPAPPGIAIEEIAATVRALRAENLFSWSVSQREQFDSAVEAAERMVSTDDPLEALRAAGGFSLNLNKCKRNNNAYNLLGTLRAQVATARFTLITEHYAAERGTLIEIFRRFDRIYRARKRQAGALDFSDLEEFTVRLLEDHPETRERLRAQFDHVLMDEFQDTNGQQARLLELIRPSDRFYAVGDLNQSIYGFRHAEPQGFRDYRDTVERTGRRLVELTGNFRSRPAILSAVETVLDGAAGIEPRSLVAGREFAGEDPPYSVEALFAPDEAAEAQWIARRLRELLAAYPQLDYKDVAVLVRNTDVLGGITAAFDDAGIPYVVNRGRGFYESREVNDLTHLLRIIANPRDEISLVSVLRSPLVGISDEALLQLRVLGDSGEFRENLGAVLMRLAPKDAAGFEPADFAALTAFRDRLRAWRMRRDYVSFDRLLLDAIDESGYLSAPNIDKFLAQARDAASRLSLADYVEELARVRADDPREPDSPPEDSANTVKVMTVHSAKGLEFPIVFLAAMHKGINTALAAVEFSPRIGVGVAWRDPASGKEVEDLYQRAIKEERERREEQEGHRLLYVAMTRAEHHLVLSFAGKKQNWASVLVKSLALDIKAPCDEIRLVDAPDGKQWALRVHITHHAADPLPAAARAEKPAAAGPLLVTAPEVAGQHDAAVTVTDLAVFASCPRKYYLGRYLGFDRPGPALTDAPAPQSGLPANELGSQVHALLAGESVGQPDAEAERLAAVFRESPLGRRAARASRVEREFDFVMSLEGVIVRGQVDVWFEEGGELVIVDYKTDAVSAAEALQRAAGYSLQLRLYAAAVERIAGRRPDRAYLHFLRPGRIVEVDLAPSLLDSPEQIARDLMHAQESLEFPLHEGPQCRGCAFYGELCPAGTSHSTT